MRSGRDTYLNGKPLKSVLSQKARASLGLAAVGAVAGVLQCMSAGHRRRVHEGLAMGMLGSAFGFLAGFIWKTRDLSSSMIKGAAKNMETVRDGHWLETHPVDYA
jgi:hypothetical protein